MPLYNFTCTNTHCIQYSFSQEILAKTNLPTQCPYCGSMMNSSFPLSIHVKGEESTIDGKDRGKVTKEKNESLKKKWDGYSYEQQNLRKKIEKMAADKISKAK